MLPFFKKILVQGGCEHKKGVGGFGMAEIGEGGLMVFRQHFILFY